jgi:hypothetical protein
MTKHRKAPGARIGGIRISTDVEQDIISTAVRIYKASGEPVSAKMVAARTSYNINTIYKNLAKNQELFTIELGFRNEKLYRPRKELL